jgi:hypothetical protein
MVIHATGAPQNRSSKDSREDAGSGPLRRPCVQQEGRNTYPSGHGIWVPVMKAGRYVASPVAANHRVPGWSLGHITLAMAAHPCLTVMATNSQNHQNQVTAVHLDSQ